MGAVVVRVNDIGLPVTQVFRQAQEQAGTQSVRFTQRGHWPTTGFNVVGEDAAAAQGDEAQGEATSIGMAGELDEQFFQPAHVQTGSDVNHAQPAFC